MINLNPTFTQISQRKIAFFCSSTLGNDIYYLKEFIDLMINVIGEQEVVRLLMIDKSNNSEVNKKIGENWNKQKGIKNSLKKLDKIIEQTKSAYDLLEDKSLKKKEKADYSRLVNKANKISLIKPEIYSLFVFLVNCTSLQRMTIPQDYFKILEHRGNKPVQGFDKRRVGDTNKTPIST